MKYLVWRPEHGETLRDAREIEACDAAMAAAEYATMYEDDQCDYLVAAGGYEMRVRVRDQGDNDYDCVVTGEVVLRYRVKLSPPCV